MRAELDTIWGLPTLLPTSLADLASDALTSERDNTASRGHQPERISAATAANEAGHASHAGLPAPHCHDSSNKLSMSLAGAAAATASLSPAQPSSIFTADARPAAAAAAAAQATVAGHGPSPSAAETALDSLDAAQDGFKSPPANSTRDEALLLGGHISASRHSAHAGPPGIGDASTLVHQPPLEDSELAAESRTGAASTSGRAPRLALQLSPEQAEVCTESASAQWTVLC